MSNHFTNAVGERSKFNEDGSFRSFPGNTIVCNLTDPRSVIEEIVRVQQEHASALPFAHKFSWTPPESFHMTVIELLCHYHRKTPYWSSFLDLDAPIEETDHFFAKALESIAFPEQFQMKVERLNKTTISVSPYDEATRQRLHEFREQVSRATGVRFPNHDSYSYHISFGYQLIQMTPEEEMHFRQFQHELSRLLVERLNVIEMGKVDYTVFEDMTKFVPYTPEARELLQREKQSV
ncbi:DUF1868 domain-containing protein [Paenibacillus allorhizosphaerae]|uniref:DUF1868 domain-containing protein n=1 Tax=Paenibacillus allorhizosphaerae TaxID=2849866 RepID=A0ABM8VPW5_9BACL|nr:DUF1868 domain-containing protein [Paenibacillus allorhizosphaerae]CAG7653491.1 hypothetical protein PAECIP111802_05498 [Paenibacillus allorhizosphaerae]